MGRFSASAERVCFRWAVGHKNFPWICEFNSHEDHAYFFVGRIFGKKMLSLEGSFISCGNDDCEMGYLFGKFLQLEDRYPSPLRSLFGVVPRKKEDACYPFGVLNVNAHFEINRGWPAGAGGILRNRREVLFMFYKCVGVENSNEE